NYHLAGCNPFDAGQQHAAAAVLFLQAPGAHLHREASGNGRHRRQDRQTGGFADSLEGDERGARGERRVEQPWIGPEVLEAEHRLAAPRPAVLRLLHLFHLDHQLAVPGIAERGAGLYVIVVREADTVSCAWLDDDVGQLLDPRRGQSHPEFAILYLARNADTHSGTRPGP